MTVVGAEALRREGVARAGAGEMPGALAALKRAWELDPESGACARDLATVEAAAGGREQAAALYARSVELGTADAACYADWGRVLGEAERWEEAAAVLETGRAKWPGQARILYLLGRAYLALERHGESLGALEECLEVDPPIPGARLLYAHQLSRHGYSYAAREELEVYRSERPEDPRIQPALVSVEWHCGELENCLRACERTLEAGRMQPFYSSFYRVIRIHRAGETALSLRETHASWPALAEPVTVAPGHDVEDFNPERKLRLGLVANQFARGPYFHFVTPILRDRDREAFEVICYHTSWATDAHTEILKDYADHWRQETDRNELARRIREDRIDILLELSGHYGGHLPVFLERRAPVHLALPTEYPGTTGLGSFDYILTDRWACAEGQEGQYTEPAYFLPNGYLTYNPPAAVEIGPLPAQRNGRITFGLFQRPAKLNGPVWDAIAGVLRAVPDSELLIHYSAAELDDPEEKARGRLQAEVERRGVSGARLRFRGAAPLPEHLALLAETDIALDAFPYNGQTTTCECVWMGVPVVTLAGETHVSRVGCAILSQVGLAHLVAGTVEEYVGRAAELAGDLEGLARTRSELRERLLASPMVNGAAVRGLEAAWREIWRERCMRERGQ